jgi:uncharacterized protein YbjT (DUF2867 family)
MKVLITGATGFVGWEVFLELHHLEAGHSIRILSRERPKSVQSKSVKEIASSLDAEILRGDVLDGSSLTTAVQGVDAVIHLVGIISEVGDQTFENVHIRGTQNIITAAQQAGVKRFVHMSALGTRPDAVSRYHQSKWIAEEIVRGSKLDYTIFRPSIIYGPEDHFVNLFASMAKYSPMLPVMGDGRAKMQPVAVADVAKCFVDALAEPKAVGQTYDLCGPEALSFDAILDTILQVTGRKRMKLHIPMALARMQAAVLEFLFPLFGKAPPLNRDQLLMLQEDNIGDPRLAADLFDVKPVSFKEGIAAYLKK